MMLYLKSRRAAWLLFAATAAGIAGSISRAGVVVPGIIGGGEGSTADIPTIAALALSVTAAACLRNRHTHLTRGAARSTGWMDSVLLLSLCAVILLVTAAAPTPQWDAARNCILLTSCAAGLSAISNPPVATITTGLLTLFMLTYGSSAPGGRFVRILQAPAGSTWALLATTTCLGAGLLALAASSKGSVGNSE